MKKLSRKLNNSAKDAMPIQYMLNIPVVKVILKDEKGKEIEVAVLQQYKNGIVVVSKDGSIYSNVKIGKVNKK